MAAEQLLMDTAMLAGEIMQQSGAETYRVEDTMSHIMKKSRADHIEASALTTVLTISLQDDGEQPITLVRRVNHRSMNLERIVRVNEISRSFCSDRITLEEAYDSLKAIRHEQGKLYHSYTYMLAMIGLVAGFAIFFGGGVVDVAGSSLVACMILCINWGGKKLKINNVFQDISASIGIAFTSIILRQYVFTDMNLETVIISGIMPLVPGVAITNAVRDTLMGDYLSGAARILEAFMQAAAIAVGIGVGIAIVSAMIGEKVLL